MGRQHAEWRDLGEVRLPGDWWTSSLARLSTLEHKQMDDFFISGASRVDGPSTCTNPQRSLPIASVFFPASSGLASDTVSENQSLRDAPPPPDVLFLKLETKCLLGNPLFHARPSGA